MRRGACAGIALALVGVVSATARGQSFCVEDLDIAAPAFEPGVRLGAGKGRGRDGEDGEKRITIDRSAGALSLGGRNPTVHGGYNGCGERVGLASGRSRLSYARSEDWNPWRRLDGDAFATEHFLDATVEGPGDGPVEAGYALNMYAAEEQASPFGSRGSTRNVTGSEFWLSGLDDRIKLRSALGVDAATPDGEVPLAHHHELEIVPLRFGDGGEVFASLGYDQADVDFEAGHGAYLPPDERTFSAATGYRFDAASVRLDYRRGRDNLGDDEALTTNSYQEMAGRLAFEPSIDGLWLPDRISLRGSFRDEIEDFVDSGTTALRHATAGWGVNMLWRDDATYGGLDISGNAADSSALARAGVLPSQRVGVELGTGFEDVLLSGRLFSEWQDVSPDQGARAAMDYGGTLSAAAFGQKLEGSVAYGRTMEHAFDPALRWGLAAELDALELFGRKPGDSGLFALGRLESQFAEDTTGWQSEYTAKVVAGFRF